jgi:hypothetical protein
VTVTGRSLTLSPPASIPPLRLAAAGGPGHCHCTARVPLLAESRGHYTVELKTLRLGPARRQRRPTLERLRHPGPVQALRLVGVSDQSQLKVPGTPGQGPELRLGQGPGPDIPQL